jgi:pimeloyl-ACP methyl ester carboxylesterase
MFHRRFGKGPAVIFQHGFLGGSGIWAPQIAHFSRNYDVIAPDLPGFAASGQLLPPESLEGFGSLLIKFLDEQSIDRFSLVGHSIGGMIALQVALDYPDRIDRLVLYGTAPSGASRERFESIEQSIARILSQGIDLQADIVVGTWFVAGAAAPYFEMARAAGSGLLATTAAKIMKSTSEWDVSDRLGEIKAPTLVICGDRDRSCPPNESLRLWRSIKNVDLAIVPNCSHCVHLERTDLFNGIVSDFLGSR